MKLKQNVVKRFVLGQNDLNRVAAVYSLLMSIDKRLNQSKKNSPKVAKKKSKESTTQNGYDIGSPKKRASVIIVMKVITPTGTSYYHDRHDYTHHSLLSFFGYQA